MASAAITLTIQADILADCDKSESDLLQAYLSDWSVKIGDVPDPIHTKQPFRDSPGTRDMRSSINKSVAAWNENLTLVRTQTIERPTSPQKTVNWQPQKPTS